MKQMLSDLFALVGLAAIVASAFLFSNGAHAALVAFGLAVR